jgi:hypothetical protein
MGMATGGSTWASSGWGRSSYHQNGIFGHKALMWTKIKSYTVGDKTVQMFCELALISL